MAFRQESFYSRRASCGGVTSALRYGEAGVPRVQADLNGVSCIALEMFLHFFLSDNLGQSSTCP